MSNAVIYAVRHGIAADLSASCPNDEDRPLTEEGIERLCVQFRALRDLGVELDHVVTSPLVRARQTGEWLSAAFKTAPALVVCDALRPGGRYDAVMADLARLPRARHVALVGHEPSIGMLAAGLIGLRGSIPFKKGAVCRISVDGIPPSAPGQLEWFLPPRVLRQMVR
jgi:phosphohistidine phosphatase